MYSYGGVEKIRPFLINTLLTDGHIPIASRCIFGTQDAYAESPSEPVLFTHNILVMNDLEGLSSRLQACLGLHVNGVSSKASSDSGPSSGRRFQTIHWKI
ncbi:hypothetical protein GSI_04415 [Ganoderma sinense ZZ0214-1]|uniref:Uncharacterized protein n=1 Tax=Ganoderma sinense ZZ0214-1 TaxID=1077348 RepID=A0A2G8SJ66_9APHY|nr:hypothetical protein GSI_04415 [Ganoderma sinense ZZ0214-1]